MKYVTLFILTILCSYNVIAQTIESKSCGKCHKPVSINSSAGQRCPHCGVRWGRESTSTTTRYTYEPPAQEYAPPIVKPPIVNPYFDASGSNYNSERLVYEQSNTIKYCNLRSGPTTNSTVLGSLPKDFSITITKISGDWVKIRFYGNSDYGEQGRTYVGWLHKSNVVL
jgi:uncharacterized protein YgiM (DUF1202 family)